jgi:hypothetical protein
MPFPERIVLPRTVAPVRGSYVVPSSRELRNQMSIDPDINGEHPEPAGTSPNPTVILMFAAACGAVTGYFTDWETAASVFVAAVSLFTQRSDR